MNFRKRIDYSDLFAAIDRVMAEDLAQMELYCEIGRLINGRPEKGTAVAAAEYLQAHYPDASGFSPRNVRRMREFYHAFEGDTAAMCAALEIGWTQNVVILEADLTPEERVWYICAVRQLGWSKLTLAKQIADHACDKITLDTPSDACYTDLEEKVVDTDDAHPLRMSRQESPALGRLK